MTKEQLFDQTNGGLSIFEALIPEVGKNGYKKGKLFPSPLRDDKTASANLIQAGNIYLYYDFGTNDKLNAIDFVMKLEGIDFKSALEFCSKRVNLQFIDRPAPPVVDVVVLRPSDTKVSKMMEVQNTDLHKYCTEVLGIAPEHLIKWGLGGYLRTKDEVETVFTAFVFRDHKGAAVNIKYVPYNPETGKRRKEVGFFSCSSKKDHETYKFCLFGAHLVQPDAIDRPLVVVESEKTAIIASYRKYRDFDFVASRGKSGAGLEEIKALNLNPDKPILILCDADSPRTVPRMFKELEGAGMNVHLVDLIPTRMDKTDLADYIHERMKIDIPVPPTIKLTVQATGETQYQSSKPDWANHKAGPKLTPKQRRELYNQDLKNNPQDQDKDGKAIDRVFGPDHYIQDEAFTDTYDPKRALHESGCYHYQNMLWVIENERTVSISNFTITILQELHHGDRVIRLCKLSNKLGITKTVEMTGKDLITLNNFKVFCFDQGNFEFNGNQSHLDKLRAYVANQASRSTTVEILGWNNKGRFFALANGIIKDGRFYEGNSEGLVISESFSYYIRFGNESNENADQIYINERRVWFNDQPAKRFVKWANLHYKVFNSHGMVAQVFGVMALFSDFIYKQRNSVPLLFLYGSASSGKGSLAKSIQQLFGSPQEALNLAGKASTPKAMVRKLANFINLAMLLEEYILTDDNDNFLKSIWDRMGYERAKKDMSYGSDVVPITSAVMVTSNNYPVNEAVVQRLVVREMHESERSEAARDLFEELKQFETGNLTTLLPDLLMLRDAIEANYLPYFLKWEKKINKEWAVKLPADRMYSNAACLLAVCQILKDKYPGIEYDTGTLSHELEQCLTQQAGKLSGGGEASSFFDTIQYAINEGDLIKGYAFSNKGDKLLLNIGRCWAHYNKYCKLTTGTMPLGKSTLIDKLKKDRSYVETCDSVRGDSDGFKSSAMIFDMKKMDTDIAGTIEAVINGIKIDADKQLAESIASTEPPAETSTKLGPAPEVGTSKLIDPLTSVPF